MLILPHGLAGGHDYKVLPPMRRLEWQQPSVRSGLYTVENETRFRLTARLDDGHVRWRGWFDSREDADAFLYALARHVALNEPMPRELWRLPTPAWHPGISLFVTYDFAIQVFLTTPTGSNQTYTSPSDWNNSNNSIETIGGGGSAGNGSSKHVSGAGGGAWNKITNFNFATPGTTTATYQIGSLVAGQAVNVNGLNGNDSWFNGTTLAGSSVGSKAGLGGVVTANNVTANGGLGGVGASGVGTPSNDGGRGGNITGTSTSTGTGGGGAAGSTGAGNNGVDDAGASPVATNGGSGDAGVGGAGGTGGNGGGNGTEWDATHGSGGGGSGKLGPPVGGGNYGGGGGGNRQGLSIGGGGAQGIIVLIYTPGLSPPFRRRGMPRSILATM